LCLADGEGRIGVFLASKGLRVTGVDSSAVGLAKAERLATERAVPYTTVLADLSVWDLGTERWDGVVSIWAHLPAPVRAARCAPAASCSSSTTTRANSATVPAVPRIRP
jgi:hypothetical protein